jgi:hypothetical protein
VLAFIVGINTGKQFPKKLSIHGPYYLTIQIPIVSDLHQTEESRQALFKPFLTTNYPIFGNHWLMSFHGIHLLGGVQHLFDQARREDDFAENELISSHNRPHVAKHKVYWINWLLGLFFRREPSGRCKIR